MRGRGMVRSVLLEQAAELLGVSRRTVYYRIREGRLRTVRTMGGSQRVLLESIERLLREELGLTVPGAGVSDTDPSVKFPAP
jgi:excisionase family DNA binding protein